MELRIVKKIDSYKLEPIWVIQQKNGGNWNYPFTLTVRSTEQEAIDYAKKYQENFKEDEVVWESNKQNDMCESCGKLKTYDTHCTGTDCDDDRCRCNDDKCKCL